MNAKAFLDTNIFVYTIDKTAPPAKRSTAKNLVRDALQHRRSVISYQVIQEFLNVATTKSATKMSVADAQQYMSTVLQPLLSVHPSVELFQDALDIGARFQLSWYDSLIVAAAAHAGCAVLYTEDLSHGAKIQGVRIDNPFRSH